MHKEQEKAFEYTPKTSPGAFSTNNPPQNHHPHQKPNRLPQV
jgi:hypothetical protein